jgi:hypothetical protein
MGLFDMFKKKKEEPAATEAEAAPAQKQQGSPWPDRLRDYWHWEDEQKLPAAEALLNDIGQHLENAKIKRKTDEDELDLRGRIEGIPVRVEFEVDMGWVGVEMKCQNGLGAISLEWDPEKVPVEADDDDDWADDDELRVFVGKAVFIEGDSDDVNQTLGTLSRMPPDLANELILMIQNQPIQVFFMHPESMTSRFKKNFYEMADPVAEIMGAAQVMARVTKAIGDPDLAAAAPAGAGAPASLHLVKCTYCSSRFNLGGSPRCPNCGAPHDG